MGDEARYLGSWTPPDRRFLTTQLVIGCLYCLATAAAWVVTVPRGADVSPGWLAVTCGLGFVWSLGHNLQMAFWGRPVPWRRRLALGGLDFRRWRWVMVAGILVFFLANFAAALSLPADFRSDALEGSRWLCAAVAAMLCCGAGVAALVVVLVIGLPLSTLLTLAFPVSSDQRSEADATVFERMWPLEKVGFSVALLSVALALAVAVPASMDLGHVVARWCVAGFVLAAVGLVVGVVLNNRGVAQRQAEGIFTEFG